MSNDKVVMSKDTIWSRIVLQWVKGTLGRGAERSKFGQSPPHTLFSLFKRKKTMYSVKVVHNVMQYVNNLFRSLCMDN